MHTLDEILERVEALPPAPQVLPKLLKALDEPDADITRVADLIAFDPGLTAKVLQLCNSAALSGAARVSDIAEAVNRLGLQRIYRLVAASSGRQVLHTSRPIPGLAGERLWKHSVIVALAAQLMAKDHGDDESGAFTAALLHDIGKVVLAEAFKDQYSGLLPSDAAAPGRLAQEEQTRLGLNHAGTGGRLLARWQFPAPLVEGVTFHHQPAGAGAARRLAACISLADSLAYLLDKPASERTPASVPVNEGLAILQLSPEGLLRYLDRTLENFEFVEALCRL